MPWEELWALQVALSIIRFLVSGEPDNCLDGQLDLKWEEKQILDVTKKTIPDDKGMKMEKKKMSIIEFSFCYR